MNATAERAAPASAADVELSNVQLSMYVDRALSGMIAAAPPAENVCVLCAVQFVNTVESRTIVPFPIKQRAPPKEYPTVVSTEQFVNEVFVMDAVQFASINRPPPVESALFDAGTVHFVN